MFCERSKVPGVIGSIGKSDVERRAHLGKRIIFVPMHGERKYAGIRGKDRRRTVALMHIEINHQRALYRALCAQLFNGDRDVVEHAETFTVVAERMVRTTGEIPGDAACEARARREQSATRRESRPAPERLAPWQSQAPHLGSG